MTHHEIILNPAQEKILLVDLESAIETTSAFFSHQAFHIAGENNLTLASLAVDDIGLAVIV